MEGTCSMSRDVVYSLIETAHPALEVRNLSVRYGGVQALEEVNLEVPSQGRVGLIGPNGAGKTTLFNAVSGFVQIASGEIMRGGHSLVGLSPNKRAHVGLGRTFQHPQLVGGLTALDNVLLGSQTPLDLRLVIGDLTRRGVVQREAALRDQAMALLDLLGASKNAATLAGRLPLGVQRRVEIARAMMGQPDVLLLDEPASGVDSAEAQEMLGHLSELQENESMAVLLIEHNMHFLMQAVDVVYVLDFGRLIASGSPSEIQNNERVIHAYLGSGRGHV